MTGSAALQPPTLKERILEGKRRQTKCRLLVLGLDNSGKTTIIGRLNPTTAKPGAAPLEVTPTVGFQQSEFSRGTVNFTVFDMSGQSRYRELWSHYYREAQGVIFVVDAGDRARLCVAKDEVGELLGHKDMAHKQTPFLFLANKSDLPDAMTVGRS